MNEQLSYAPQDGTPIVYSGNPYVWPNPSALDAQRVASSSSTGTVEKTSHRKVSSGIGSGTSTPPGTLHIRNENVIPSRDISLFTLDFLGGSTNVSTPRKSSFQASHKSSWGTDSQVTRRSRQTSGLLLGAGPLEDVELNAVLGGTGKGSLGDTHGGLKRGFRRGLPFEIHAEEDSNLNVLEPLPRQYEAAASVPTDTKPHIFNKWMRTLRHKTPENRSMERWSLDGSYEARGDEQQASASAGRKHNKSSSTSSSAFVTAVKSASASLVALSVAPKSRKTRVSTTARSNKRSSRVSHTTNRTSLESCLETVLILDEAAWDRAIQRRRALEELVNSEESYIADLKVLLNGYFPLLASAPTSSPKLHTQIQRNVSEILTLHEELLRKIRDVLPNSDLRSDVDHRNSLTSAARHRQPSAERPRPLAGPVSTLTHGSFELSNIEYLRKCALVSEPREVALVAKVFDKMLSRFFAYEEYSAEYESSKRDMIIISNSIPNWHAYERGIEALANSLAPGRKEDAYSRKGLAFEDLLIKPVQRICKYPLIFSDLHKHTPVIDCPDAHAEIEKVKSRLDETMQEIDTATNDPKTRENIQRTWQLQDILVFPNAASPPFALRTLGHPTLCGVLHCAYQTKHGIRGNYMLCVLFKSCLILAVPDSDVRQYQIVVCVGLRDFRVESTENGKGLQCDTALHSWKIIFEFDQRLFEMILSACSEREEEVWRTRLLTWSVAEGQKQAPILYTFLSLNLKAIGRVSGHPGTLARRLSVQRAATVGFKADVRQVIIKDTHALKQLGGTQLRSSSSMSRSQSLLLPSRITVLSPKRAERIRIEQSLEGVWTRDVLPYPGMTYRRGDYLIRASASSMMRKLSRASKTSNINKRPTSQTSIANLTTSILDVTEDELEEASNGDVVSSRWEEFNPTTNTIFKKGNTAAIQVHEVLPPPKTRSASDKKQENNVRLCQSSNNLRSTPIFQTATGNSNAAQPGSKYNQPGNSRWSSPSGLARAMSTQGIRAFFS